MARLSHHYLDSADVSDAITSGCGSVGATSERTATSFLFSGPRARKDKSYQVNRWFMLKRACPNCWAGAAAQGVERARQAALDAEEDYKVISVADAAAQKAWRDVQSTLERIRQSDVFYRKQAPLKDPNLRPFWKFCNQLDNFIKEAPNKKDETEMKELREYCENLQDGFTSVKPVPEFGYRMYDQAPQEEPMYGVNGGMPKEPAWLTDNPHGKTEKDLDAPEVPPKILKMYPVSVSKAKRTDYTGKEGVIPYVGGRRYYPRGKDPLGPRKPKAFSWLEISATPQASLSDGRTKDNSFL